MYCIIYFASIFMFLTYILFTRFSDTPSYNSEEQLMYPRVTKLYTRTKIVLRCIRFVLNAIVHYFDEPTILRHVASKIVYWFQKVLKITFTLDEPTDDCKLDINILPFIPTLSTNIG